MKWPDFDGDVLSIPKFGQQRITEHYLIIRLNMPYI
jgi:hypothetical protein